MTLFAQPYPPTPATDWRPPAEFPRLDDAPTIAMDLETYDPNMTTKGPGWGRSDGHIVGLAIGVPPYQGHPTGGRWYFPMRHEYGGGNLSPELVLRWAARELGRRGQPKIGANLQYDVGWLKQEGVCVEGPFIDVQYAEPLLDEHRRSYSLDALAETYLDEHKVDEALYDWLYRAYGGTRGRWQARNIYRAPVELVGPYAEGDVDLPLRIWERQRPLLIQQGLMELFELECKLIPILVEMRFRGSPVDAAAVEPAIRAMTEKKTTALARLKALTGFAVNPDETSSLVRAFDALGLRYPKTPKGNPSFRKDFLERHPHEIGTLIREVRRWEKYVQYAVAYQDRFIHNGVIHGSYHPLRGDDGGTIVGRFSSSSPNLTNIPSRDPEAKKILRGMFVPWQGERWRSRDYSQIQFRIMTHYAQGTGAEEARQRYRDDPTTDYHNMVQALIAQIAGVQLDRKPVKNINFGLAFTMGLEKLARELGKSTAETRELLDTYHQGLPFLRHTTDVISNRAQKRGYIFGVGGRRHRFPFWEPKCWDLRQHVPFNRDRAAVEARVQELCANPPKGLRRRPYPGVVRANTHLGLNRLAQDGEGTTIKKAMVACWEAGIYDVTGVPLNTVHDEINHSDPMTAASEEAFAEMRHIMETVQALRVPLLISDEVGPNWGDLTEL